MPRHRVDLPGALSPHSFPQPLPIVSLRTYWGTQIFINFPGEQSPGPPSLTAAYTLAFTPPPPPPPPSPPTPSPQPPTSLERAPRTPYGKHVYTSTVRNCCKVQKSTVIRTKERSLSVRPRASRSVFCTCTARTHCPTTDFQPMMADEIQACDLTTASCRMAHRERQAPAEKQTQTKQVGEKKKKNEKTNSLWAVWMPRLHARVEISSVPCDRHCLAHKLSWNAVPLTTCAQRKTELAVDMKFYLDFQRVFMAMATNADQRSNVEYARKDKGLIYLVLHANCTTIARTRQYNSTPSFAHSNHWHIFFIPSSFSSSSPSPSLSPSPILPWPLWSPTDLWCSFVRQVLTVLNDYPRSDHHIWSDSAMFTYLGRGILK